MHIRSMVASCYAQVSHILKTGNFSDAAIEKASNHINKFAGNLEKQLIRKGLLPEQEDNDKITFFATTTGDAIGSNTSTDSKLNAVVADNDKVSISLGTATSLAVASGGVELTSTASFTSVTGADFTVTKAYNTSGKNWEKTTELVFAVDFKFLEDLNLNFGREYNRVTNKIVSLDGNVATAEFNVTAKAEHTSVSVMGHVLAIEDTLSSSYLDAGIYIA